MPLLTSRPVLLCSALVVVLSLVLLCYLWFKKPRAAEAMPEGHLEAHVPMRPSGLPLVYPPVYAADVPGLQSERNWSPTAQTYIDLISFALCTPTICCLPIDPACLPAILLWYEDKRKDFAIHLRVLHPGSADRMARVVVSSLESPTGKHPAIRP